MRTIDAREQARRTWTLGDYDRVARDVLRPLGAELVAACGIGPSTRVLDVAAGSGNVALQAAAAGADVTASDLTPALLDAGRARAARRGLNLAWVEADAQDLPFGDGAFDVVTSAIGAMFAPDHDATARELLRVCRPGGVIGTIAWPPGSWTAEFFGVLAAYQPPSDGPSPLLWGVPGHVRERFGDGVTAVEATPGTLVVDHFATPREMSAYYREYFGPILATDAALGDDHARRDALARDLDAFAERTNAGAPDDAVYRYDYMRIVARRR